MDRISGFPQPQQLGSVVTLALDTPPGPAKLAPSRHDSMENTRNLPARDKSAILRLKTFAGSPRQWGRMSSHQMICHLGDAFKLPSAKACAPTQPGQPDGDQWITSSSASMARDFKPPEVNQEGRLALVRWTSSRTHSAVALIERSPGQEIFNFSLIPSLGGFLSGSGSAGATCTWIITCGSLVREALESMVYSTITCLLNALNRIWGMIFPGN
jgi:hypothetical protein